MSRVERFTQDFWRKRKMAKADLVVNVGTKYNGEALKKLNAGIRDSAKVAKSAGQALGSITSELGQMGGAAGKAAGAVSGLMSAMMAGGPVAIAIGAITTAIGFVVKAFKDAKEAAKEAAATIRDSFGQSIDSITDRLRGVEQFWAKVRKNLSNSTNNTQAANDLVTRSLKADSEIAFTQQRQSMSNNYDKARSKAKQSYDTGMLDTNDKLTKAETNVVNVENNLNTLNAEIEDLKKGIVQMEKESITQFTATVDSEVKKQFDKLNADLVSAKYGLAKYGENAKSNFTETRTRLVRSANSPGGMAPEEYEVNLTYKEALEKTAKSLNEFKKENEEQIKGIEEYNKSLKKIKEEEKRLQDKIDGRAELEEKLAIAKEEQLVVDKEVTAARMKL